MAHGKALHMVALPRPGEQDLRGPGAQLEDSTIGQLRQRAPTHRGPRIISVTFSALRSRESYRHRLDSEDPVRSYPRHRPGELYVGKAPQELRERYPCFQARERRAQAEMPAAAEGEVIIRCAPHVERVRSAENILVAVAGHIPEDDLVAGGDLLPAQLRVAHGVAAEIEHRGGEA